MATRSRNPFKTLGLTPDILKGVGESEAKTLVQTMYRALARILHPDAGGSDRAFTEIAQAYERLADTEVFQTELASYLKPRKSRVATLETELEETVVRLDSTTGLLRNYLETLTRLGGITIPGEKILLHDVMKSTYTAEVLRDSRSAKKPQSSYLELSVQDGRVVSQRKMRYNGQIPLPEGLSSGYHLIGNQIVRIMGEKGHESALSFVPQGTETEIAHSVIGCVPSNVTIEGKTVSRGLPKTLAIAGEHQGSSKQGTSWGEFEPFLLNLVPWIEENQYLITGKLVGSEFRLGILGKMISVINPEG